MNSSIRLLGRLVGECVYFIRGLSCGLLKIGCSNNLGVRIHNIALDRREAIEVLGVMPGTFRHERATHRRFAAHHVGQEWFTDAPEIRAFVAAFPPEHRPVGLVEAQPAPKKPRSPYRKVSDAEHNARRTAAFHTRAARHGHPGTWSKDTCAKCIAERQFYRSWCETRKRSDEVKWASAAALLSDAIAAARSTPSLGAL